VCPRCGSQDVCHLDARPLFECYLCRKQFSLTSGTIFHGRHLPLKKWLLAAALICNAKKGIGAKQIVRELKPTHKTACYLMHGIRRAMREPGSIELFVGIVEIDDTYVGGKAHGKRGIIGTYHKISLQCLPNYLGEFAYRFIYTRNENSVNLSKRVLGNALIFNPNMTKRHRS